MGENDKTPISQKTPAPQNQPIESKKSKTKRENIRKQTAGEPAWPIKIISPALKTLVSHHRIRVSKIDPQRYWEGNKSSALLRGSAPRRGISIPMSDQGAACKSHWHLRHRKSIIKWVHRITPDLIQLQKHCQRSTMCNVTLKHIPG